MEEQLLLLSEYEKRSDMSALIVSDSISSLSIVDEKVNDAKDDTDDKNKSNLYLEIAIIGPVFSILLKLMHGYDIPAFLSCCKFLMNSNVWGIIMHQLGIPRNLMELLPIENRMNDRVSTLFIVNQLGYACCCCLKPLDGREGSLFACTSLCRNCSLQKFTGSDFVEGTIRFYLSGLDSITIKGYAFLTYPYFVCIDEDVKTKIDVLFGSAFEVAIAILQEKIFFSSWAPKSIKRPRDDKAKTLRAMIDAAEDKKRMKNLLNFSFSRKDAVPEEKELPWLKFLPLSLMSIYQNEIKKKESGESLSIPLGALPLRDLVKTMFEKDSSFIKKLN